MGYEEAVRDFYIKGYTTGEFKPSPSHKRLLGSLKSMQDNSLKDGYSLQEKYPFSRDLRPDVYSYDDSFIDILIQNEAHILFRNVLGYDPCLAHIQARVAYPFPAGQEDRSYMEWHRDSYFYDNQIRGNIPPIHKIIFYPSFGTDPVPVLGFVEGSHIKIDADRQRDYEGLKNNVVKYIKSSDSHFLAFDTSGMHSSRPVLHNIGQVRLIYSFCRKEQLHKYEAQKELHKIYLSKVGGLNG